MAEVRSRLRGMGYVIGSRTQKVALDFAGRVRIGQLGWHRCCATE